jgi:ribosomal protein L37AE/L43A
MENQMTSTAICKHCGDDYNPQRKKLGWLTCLTCGEQTARLVKHCVVPMHKSNYVPITNMTDLKGINSKGGWYR